MADIRRRAAAYSNPRLGAAFENIADMFAPPSGSDLYGYTRAGAEKAKAERLADVYRRATAPGATIEGIDLPSIAAGLYTPNASGWAVRTKDATDRRGQDITSGDNRYNTDVTARTSRANNADTNRTHVVTTYGGAIPKDAIRPELPQAIADLYGLPSIPSQRGVISAQPGERNVLPGGEVIEGAPKPLTETEMVARILGNMPPEQQQARAFGSTPVVETPKGPMTRPQQLQSGTPALDDKQPQVFNSKNGPVIWDPVMRSYVDPVSRRPVDISGGLQAPSAAQGKDGTLGPTVSNQTESNRKAAQLNVMSQLVDQYDALLANNRGIVGLPGAIIGGVQNAASAVQEFSAAFGNVAPEATLAEGQVKQLAARIGASSRNPAIAQARVMQAELAYKWAQMNNPTGEVSRQAFERALSTFDGGTFANNEAAREALVAVREAIKRERTGVDDLRNPGAAPAAGAPAAPAGPRVLQTPAGAVTIEPVQ